MIGKKRKAEEDPADKENSKNPKKEAQAKIDTGLQKKKLK